jgi:hypothetical protein
MYPAAGQFDGVMGPDGEGPGLKPSTAVSSNAAASPVTAAQQTTNTTTAAGIAAASAVGANRMAQPMPTAASSPKAQKPIDKSNWNRNTKVSQGTVDAVKDLGRGNMGVKAAQDAFAIKPRLQGGVLSSGPVGASVEQKEATKRVYPNAYKGAAAGASLGGGTAYGSGAAGGKTLADSKSYKGDASKAAGARSINPTAGRALNSAGTPSNVKPWSDRFAATIVNAGQQGLEAYTPFRFNRV